MSHRFATLICAFALLMSAETADASPVTFIIEGNVSSVTNDARVQSFIGNTFTARFVFESTQPNDGGAIPNYGGYVGTSQITFSNGFTWSDNDTQIRVFNNFAQNPPFGPFFDGYDVVVGGGTEPSGLPGLIFNGAFLISLRDMTQAALQSVDLPLLPPGLDDFSEKMALVNFIDPVAHLNVNVLLDVTSFELPEPSGIALLGAGVMLLLPRLRRSRPQGATA
jgi:hypothetical protein